MQEGLVHFPIFLTALLLLMVAAKVGAEIAERLGQPSVLGEILAGVLVGASGLGLITHGFSDGQSVYQVMGLTAIQGTDGTDTTFSAGVLSIHGSFGVVQESVQLSTMRATLSPKRARTSSRRGRPP